jgi:CRISPR-associated protein Cas5d
MIFRLAVWGDYACFTRPEMKAERVSYDVMTPSAARAVMEAVFWKPAFRWDITAIEVLKPVRWANIRRNELGGVASYSGGEAGRGGVFIEDDRQQRAATILRDVKYRIHARQVMTDKMGPDDSPKKLEEMFLRRAGKGQCVMQPYLGCREFSAFFQLGESNDNGEAALAQDEDFGYMLHDMDFSQFPPKPKFFRAVMKQGRINLDGVEIRG